VLTNTGGVALDAVSVTDTLVGDILCPGSGPLEPDASLTCTGDHTITQADLDAGFVTNIAQARATYGQGEEVASEGFELTIDAAAPAALRLDVRADPETFSAVGEIITYTYSVANTGGVTLDVSVDDSEQADVACPPGPLEPGANRACLSAHTITQADIDAGSVTTFAQAAGSYGDGVATDEVSLTIRYLAREPAALELYMGSVATTFSAVGEVIEYVYSVTNTGGVVIDAVSVTDTLVADLTCPSASLEPAIDSAIICFGRYTITQADLDAGFVTNIARARGTDGQGAEVLSDEVSWTVTALGAD
jgi:uncharacterized repeat protein (TIGR01451 family)